MPLKVLIIGAGVCGPALATMLRRADPDMEKYEEITVIERAPKLRDGLQIDIRAQGISVMRKMGLLEPLRKRVVPENGTCFVDANGHAYAEFRKNDSGHGAQAMTSEYEIMRGDLVDLMYRTSLGLSPDREDDEKLEYSVTSGGNVHYVFGVTVTDISQDDSSAVSVTFSDGRRERYDLVVGADGQSSRTRRMVLKDSEATFRPINLFTAYFLIPRTDEDRGWMTWHMMPGRRCIQTRSGDSQKPTQVYMSVRTTRSADAYGVASAVAKSSSASSSIISAQKEAFAAAFADQKGWRVPELVEALRNSTDDDDFYAAEVGQVYCDKWVQGRVVLLGDAGYCPSPITGMGTTLSLVGAYILAGELARHADADVPAALRAYEDKLRPFVKEAQKLPPGAPDILFAETWWGVWFFTTMISLMAKLRLYDLIVRFLPEDKGGLKIPEYPELKMDN
ncbi:FAD/NAD(P)-binding domain-containing protein [Xylaria scruposa]|nr:FAD/NAD(P)-binding domain-containing protein [Xylaria scruposa]